jgi:hypothetical protein
VLIAKFLVENSKVIMDLNKKWRIYLPLSKNPRNT